MKLQGQSECHIRSSQGLGTEFNYNNMHDGLTVHWVNFYMYKRWANFTNKKLQAEPRKPTTLLWRPAVLRICYYSNTSSCLNFSYLCTYSIHDEFVRHTLNVLHHRCVGDCQLITIHHTYWSNTVTIYLHTSTACLILIYFSRNNQQDAIL